MFKRTVIGLALAAALEDLTAPPYNHSISDATREAIWEEFEEGMRQALRGVPKTHKAVITPSSTGDRYSHGNNSATSTAFAMNTIATSGSQQALLSTATPSLTPPLAESSAAAATPSAVGSVLLPPTAIPAGLDPSAQFPMYRYVDGKWTILLKDVEVRVKVPTNTSIVTTTTTSASAATSSSTANNSNNTATYAQRSSKASLKDISVHCDYLEIEAEGTLAKAQRQLEASLRREELEKLHKSISLTNTNKPAGAKNKRNAVRSKKGAATKRGREDHK